MVSESVRGCPREADARGPAFPRDLHSVTAVTLSVLRPGRFGSAFPGLEIQDFLHVLGLLLPPRIQQLCGEGYWVCGPSAPTMFSWGKGRKRKGQRLPSSLSNLGPAPHAYADILASPLVPPPNLHMHIFFQSRSCGH